MKGVPDGCANFGKFCLFVFILGKLCRSWRCRSLLVRLPAVRSILLSHNWKVKKKKNFVKFPKFHQILIVCFLPILQRAIFTFSGGLVWQGWRWKLNSSAEEPDWMEWCGVDDLSRMNPWWWSWSFSLYYISLILQRSFCLFTFFFRIFKINKNIDETSPFFCFLFLVLVLFPYYCKTVMIYHFSLSFCFLLFFPSATTTTKKDRAQCSFHESTFSSKKMIFVFVFRFLLGILIINRLFYYITHTTLV